MKKYAYVDRVLLFAVVQSLPCENAAELWRLIMLQSGKKEKKSRGVFKNFKRCFLQMRDYSRE